MRNKTRDKVKIILKETHLCSNKVEMLIKVGIWCVSWIGGILALKNTADKTAQGSAYFLFSIPLMLEFAPKIIGKKEFVSKLLHSILCLSTLAMLLMSIALLFGVKPTGIYYKALFALSVFVLSYVMIDFFILWLSNENTFTQEDSKILDTSPDKTANTNEQSIFLNKQLSGNLGNIEKGKNNE